MKKYILLLITTMCFSVLNAQVLYTETFNSYPAGNLGTDYTGAIPAQGGWYTQDQYFANPNYNHSNADYQIVPEFNRGNILYLGYTNTAVDGYHRVFRNDIENIWQQRFAGNNVLKVSFDIFTQEANFSQADVFLYKERGELFRIIYSPVHRYLNVYPSDNSVLTLKNSNGSLLVLPVNTWLTVEVYIDYNNSEFYVSIPLLNYTTKVKLKKPLLLQDGVDRDGNPIPDDNPTKLTFIGPGGIPLIPNPNPFRLRIDNINFSAQNTVPVVTVGINEVLSNSFNIYPNPATNVVTITNNENRFVKEVAVYNTAGKLISTQNFNEQTEIQLNVEHLASGTYMLHLQTAEGKAVKKLVKK